MLMVKALSFNSWFFRESCSLASDLALLSLEIMDFILDALLASFIQAVKSKLSGINYNFLIHNFIFFDMNFFNFEF